MNTNGIRKHSMLESWVNINYADMKIFNAILAAMGS